MQGLPARQLVFLLRGRDAAGVDSFLFESGVPGAKAPALRVRPASATVRGDFSTSDTPPSLGPVHLERWIELLPISLAKVHGVRELLATKVAMPWTYVANVPPGDHTVRLVNRRFERLETGRLAIDATPLHEALDAYLQGEILPDPVSVRLVAGEPKTVDFEALRKR